MSKLNHKVVIVTGASKGIGAEIAKQMGAAGAKVVVNYASSKEGADAVVAEIEENGGTAVAIQGDLSNSTEVKSLFAATKKVFGTLDVLVNNAGVYQFAPIEDITEEEFHRQFNINVLGPILATQEAVRLFGENGGSIINMSSVVSKNASAMGSVYSATKSAVDSLTQSFAKELGPKKIRVNSICPGITETEGTNAMEIIGSDFERQAVANTPFGRVGQPNDIAKVAVFLASDDAAWITGESISVSGGLK
ncbi:MULTISPECIES: SDR family NAD(P)-dependent oxidoreductase [unclassified Flavobacterium]|uniref:SDR family NAD(P)-dependent oxidoreductase n=1 Tax=unclassified Flavobacterium TaxID=196869 RepID=UPI003F91BFFB